MDYKEIFQRIQAATLNWAAKLETSKLHQKIVMCESEEEKLHIFWHGDDRIDGFITLCNKYHTFNADIINIFNTLQALSNKK